MSFDHQLVSAHFSLLYILSSHENIQCTCFAEPGRLSIEQTGHQKEIIALQIYLFCNNLIAKAKALIAAKIIAQHCTIILFFTEPLIYFITEKSQGSATTVYMLHLGQQASFT